jgi:hypothetical protein
MEEGLFLDGVAVTGDHLPVHQGDQRSGPVFPNPADAPASFPNDAAVAAQVAAHFFVFQFFIEVSFLHDDDLLGQSMVLVGH